MKRSEINRNLQSALDLLGQYGIALPEWGYWTLDEWRSRRSELSTVMRTMLGWDITDFGQDRFDEFGAVLFTLRNGLLDHPDVGTPYAEKLIILKDGQRLPIHHHASKTEDIINRAGGILAIRLWHSLPDGSVDEESDVTVELDGIRRTVAAGSTIEIKPGGSITLRPYMYHLFWARKGAGDLICGEVSSVNDDRTDNYNAEPVARFTTVEEDEAILRPLCNEYAEVLGEAE